MKRQRKYAWQTGIRFPSSLKDNVSAVKIGPRVSNRIAEQIINRFLA